MASFIIYVCKPFETVAPFIIYVCKPLETVALFAWRQSRAYFLLADCFVLDEADLLEVADFERVVVAGVSSTVVSVG